MRSRDKFTVISAFLAVIGFLMTACGGGAGSDTGSLTGTVTIDNMSPIVGSTLTAAYNGGNGTGAAAWQWLANDSVIYGANSNIYQTSDDDIGKALKARVSYSDQSGSVTSAATAAVAPATVSVTLNSVEEFEAWLAAQPTNTTANAYRVTLNISNIAYPVNLKTILDNNPNKYVYLDFSGATISTIHGNAFASCDTLTGMTLRNIVTGIGQYAFLDCVNFTSITIPDSVTVIGDYAFSGCTEFADITIGSGVSSIGANAFQDCDNLRNITIRTDKVTNSETNNWGTRFPAGSLNVTFEASVGHYAFNGCTRLAGLTIGSGVTGIGTNAFSGCTGLTGPLAIPDGVTDIGANAFSGCTGLTGITIPDGVTYIRDGAFSGCTSLTGALAIPDSVTSIGDGAFENCTGLESITIGSGVTYIEVTAFSGCTSLRNITIKTNKVPQWRYILAPAGNLNVTFESAESVGYSAFSQCTNLASVTIGNSVTSIEIAAFNECTNLASVTIGNSVTSIGWMAFYGCTRLTSVTFARADTAISNISANVEAFPAGSSLIAAYSAGGAGIYTRASGGTQWEKAGANVELAAWLAAQPDNTAATAYTVKLNTDSIDGIGETLKAASNKYVYLDLSGSTFTTIGNTTFSGCYRLTGITIPNSVTTIRSEAFISCTGLTSITIPNSVTSIEARAFYNCSSLASVTIPNSVTTIGSEAFRETPWLDNQPDGLVYAGKVAYIYKGAMPANTSITLSAGTKGIASGVFYGCTSLTGITIPNSVTSIGGWAFYGCTSLTSITIPDSVTSIGDEAFRYCTSLTSVTFQGTISSANFSWNAFGHSEGFGYIGDLLSKYLAGGIGTYTRPSNGDYETWTIQKFPYGDFSYSDIGIDVTIIGYTGAGGALEIPSAIGGKKVVGIGNSVFSDCTGLTSVTIPSSVTSIGGGAFYGCIGLTSVTIPSSVTSIGSRAFARCTSLASVTIPNSVTSIWYGAFEGCTSLTSVTIPNGVTSIGGYAFHYCTSLTSVTIPSSVTSIEYGAFSSSGLTSVTIPNSVTSIENNAFHYCTSLTAINVDVGNSAYTAEDGVLYNKAKTTLMQYPAGKTGTSFAIPNSVTSIGAYAFGGCANLTSITIGSGVTSIGYSAFFFSLTSITVDTGNPNYASEGGILYNKAKTEIVYVPSKISGNVTIPNSVTSIGDSAFAYCDSLASVIIPNSVISIGQEAFSYCTSLKNITIGSGVTSIGDSAFACCDSLTSVTFAMGSNITNANFGSNAFPEGYGEGGNSLKTAYSAGKAGTYTREEYGSTWTKQ